MKGRCWDLDEALLDEVAGFKERLDIGLVVVDDILVGDAETGGFANTEEERTSPLMGIEV